MANTKKEEYDWDSLDSSPEAVKVYRRALKYKSVNHASVLLDGIDDLWKGSKEDSEEREVLDKASWHLMRYQELLVNKMKGKRQ